MLFLDATRLCQPRRFLSVLVSVKLLACLVDKKCCLPLLSRFFWSLQKAFSSVTCYQSLRETSSQSGEGMATPDHASLSLLKVTEDVWVQEWEWERTWEGGREGESGGERARTGSRVREMYNGGCCCCCRWWCVCPSWLSIGS